MNYHKKPSKKMIKNTVMMLLKAFQEIDRGKHEYIEIYPKVVQF
jgi:hypothetical protein